MIARWLFQNPGIIVLAIAMIFLAGASSIYVLPQMEDPVLTRRIAVINTAIPGADPHRVETLVTDRLEERLRDDQIKELVSMSRAGNSTIVVELRDDVTAVDNAWSRIRDILSDASSKLPKEAMEPEFNVLKLKAHASIVAIVSSSDSAPAWDTLKKHADELKRLISNIQGTEDVALFGEPHEQCVVELDGAAISSLGISVGQVAGQLLEDNSQLPLGRIQDTETRIGLRNTGQIESQNELAGSAIRYGKLNQSVRLDEIAEISRDFKSGRDSIAIVDGLPAVVLGAFVRDEYRLDKWTDDLDEILSTARKTLPSGCELRTVYKQNDFVSRRIQHLIQNLFFGTAAVVAVSFLLMGWRSTIVIGLALPLTVMIVLFAFRICGVPIHQMTVTGLIIALGLLIDNAIVIVEEVRSRIWDGWIRADAVHDSIRKLAMPLFGSTLTTTLAFAPIALLPGHPGEFVRGIAFSVILAINTSFLLSMTILAALAALVQPPHDRGQTFLEGGLRSRWILNIYRTSLDVVLRWPWLGVVMGLVFPLLGLWAASTLPEQFFPPVDRQQIYVELEMPASSSMNATQRQAQSVDRILNQDAHVKRTHWFIGRSAPTFYYNVVPRRFGTPFYAQAIVDLQESIDPVQATRLLQDKLSKKFPECRLLVRQLEQGPPFEAPVELRVSGPDVAVLQELGAKLRKVLSQTSDVVSTGSELEEIVPIVDLKCKSSDERNNLSQEEISRQLYASLEGIECGTLETGNDEIPIHVRLKREDRTSLESLATLKVTSPYARQMGQEVGTPLFALADFQLGSDIAGIPHVDRQLVNEVKAYLTAGALPSQVLEAFERNLEESGFRLPDGYKITSGGEDEKRDEAVDNLLADVSILIALMLACLVISFRSFRIAAIIAAVGGLAMGLGFGAQWIFNFPLGFMAILGSMGLVGIAINDAIVVIAGIRNDPVARKGNPTAMRNVIVHCTRHVVATTITTIAGFAPLIISGGEFWPPLAVAIAAGVGCATILALYFVPCLYLIVCGQPKNALS